MIHGREANCRFCNHYQGEQRCQAFPTGIPALLWSGENLHREPYPGDQGIQYQPKRFELTLPDDGIQGLEAAQPEPRQQAA